MFASLDRQNWVVEWLECDYLFEQSNLSLGRQLANFAIGPSAPVPWHGHLTSWWEVALPSRGSSIIAFWGISNHSDPYQIGHQVVFSLCRTAKLPTKPQTGCICLNPSRLTLMHPWHMAQGCSYVGNPWLWRSSNSVADMCRGHLTCKCKWIAN